MDLRMPQMNGVEATRLIKARRPDMKVVILTVSDDEDDLVEAVKSGADGYLLKDITAEGLLEELQTLSRGEAVITKSLAGKLLDELRKGRRSGNVPDQAALSARELEVLEHVASGLSNKETASRLYITENTVKYHMKRILEKLQLENRAQVIAWAARHVPLRPAG
jgi:two-component system NarL family response regulator